MGSTPKLILEIMLAGYFDISLIHHPSPFWNPSILLHCLWNLVQLYFYKNSEFIEHTMRPMLYIYHVTGFSKKAYKVGIGV